MRVLNGEQTMMRLFFGESDKYRRQPLYLALLKYLRKEGYAGATVLHGVAGFGARSRLHTTSLLRLSEDLPLVMEIVDTEERIHELLPVLDKMMPKGLVTLEKVRVLKYASGPEL